MVDTKDMKAQVVGTVKNLDVLVKNLDSVRQKHSKAKIRFERAKTDFVTYGARRQFQIAMSDKFRGLTDPRTGEPSAEFAKMAVEAELTNDPEYITKESEFFLARDDMYLAESDVVSVSEKIGAAKAKAKLLSSMILLLAEEDAWGEAED
jgi:hypothetical protein